MEDFSSYSDQEIWNQIAAGNEDVFAYVFKKNYPGLCRIAYRMTGDTQASEDLGQEVFVDLWRKKGNLRIQTTIQGYLRRAVSNKTLNYLRDHRVKSEGEAKILDLSSSAPSAQQMLQREDLEKKVNAAILGLPERCRIIFVLSRYQRMTYAEIADDLDISVKTVENQVAKALRLLRQALGPIVGCLLFAIIHMINL